MFRNKRKPESTAKGLTVKGATFKAHIDRRGRIVIPKKLRDALSTEEYSFLTCKISKMSDARQRARL